MFQLQPLGFVQILSKKTKNKNHDFVLQRKHSKIFFEKIGVKSSDSIGLAIEIQLNIFKFLGFCLNQDQLQI